MTIEEYVVAIDEVASKQLKKCYFFEWLAFQQRQFSRAGDPSNPHRINSARSRTRKGLPIAEIGLLRAFGDFLKVSKSEQ
jgi:hypothetical protein